MKITNVTDKVEFGYNDNSYLPILKCVCGKTFGWWYFVISTDKDDPYECSECGARLYFEINVNVYQVED